MSAGESHDRVQGCCVENISWKLLCSDVHNMMYFKQNNHKTHVSNIILT